MKRREAGRAAADCTFWITDFVGTDGANGGRYDAGALAAKVAELWGQGERRLSVCVLHDLSLRVLLRKGALG